MSESGEIKQLRKRDRDLRKHIIVDLSKEKFNLHLIHLIVLLYGRSYFSDMIEAILLYTVVAIGPPIPPEVLKSSGEKQPCSTSLTLCS